MVPGTLLAPVLVELFKQGNPDESELVNNETYQQYGHNKILTVECDAALCCTNNLLIIISNGKTVGKGKLSRTPWIPHLYSIAPATVFASHYCPHH